MTMSDEQRKAASERMKAYHEAKKEATKQPQPEVAQQPKEADKEYILSQELADLKKQIEELKAEKFTPKQEKAELNQSGKLIGTYEKYVIDPDYYPDPRERLSKEPKLAQFAFPLNYELVWDVSTSQYQTQDGVNTREPKFTLQLIKIVMDENTGEPTNKRYMVRQAILHEDPQAAITVARENGLPVDESNQKSFLDEMRYIRMRDWLLEAFYPPKAAQQKKNKTEAVIGNVLVDMWEINSETPEGIPFNDLNKY